MSKTTPTKRRNRADGREILTVAVKADAMAEMDRFFGKFGGRGIKISAVGKLFEWFAGQPEWVRQIILGWDAPELSKTYADLLRRMGDQLEERGKPARVGAESIELPEHVAKLPRKHAG